MRKVRRIVTFVCLGAAGLAGTARAQQAFPRYDHVFIHMMENKGFDELIGNSNAPTINYLANKYGLATQYASVGDPSAPNYVAILAGNSFGIDSNAPYWSHPIDKPCVLNQITAAGLQWRAYVQSMPYPGFLGYGYPNRWLGVPDIDPLYASKHNGIQYFNRIRNNPQELKKMGPLTPFFTDVTANPPNFGWIAPDMCHDMHGAPVYCTDSGDDGDPSDVKLVTRADRLVRQTVSAITSAPFWAKGNNAIVILTEQGADGDTTGCCDAIPGTGRVPVIVITSHGPRGLKDATPYNHYSLSSSIQKAFGLSCLEYTCDTANVPAMAPLFTITGSKAEKE
jgi:phospholipase C